MSKRKNFNPRKWQQKWLKSGGLPPSSAAIPNMTDKEYKEYWKDYVRKCSGCGTKKVKYRKYFQDWCTKCYIRLNYNHFTGKLVQKKRNFFKRLCYHLYKFVDKLNEQAGPKRKYY